VQLLVHNLSEVIITLNTKLNPNYIFYDSVRTVQ